MLKYSSVRHLSFKECSIQDDGLSSFCQGYLFEPLHLSTSDLEPLLFSMLEPFLADGIVDLLKISTPILAIFDLSYNKLTNFSLLRPLFQSQDVGLSELMLSGNRSPHLLSFLHHYFYDTESPQRVCTSSVASSNSQKLFKNCTLSIAVCPIPPQSSTLTSIARIGS